MRRLLFVLAICLATSCSSKKDSQRVASSSSGQVMRIALEKDPTTLDPRKGRSLTDTTVSNLLFEGLTRVEPDGSISLAAAEKVTTSKDGKEYLFELKDTFWSSGDPVTAFDFEFAIKKALDPDFPSPNAFQLYVIKHAQEAKEGEVPVSQVGIRAEDPQTLRINLESPCAHFMKLLATMPFFPVASQWAYSNATWMEDGQAACVSNGPFALDSWEMGTELRLKKNPFYRLADQNEVLSLRLMHLDPSTSLQMFSKGALDWVGSPLSILPPDSLAHLQQEGKLQLAPAAGTQILRFNTTRSPFNLVKIRKAFNLAINRKEICDHILQGNQIPATGFVPTALSSEKGGFFKDNDLAQARAFFNTACKEMGITAEQFPIVRLNYTMNERYHRIAQTLQQQWKNAFGIEVVLENIESKVFYDRISTLSYDITLGSWFADFDDAVSFLELFKQKDFGPNNTGWEDARFASLLNLATKQTDNRKRDIVLANAERILMDEAPIAPIYFFMYNYMKKESAPTAFISPSGSVNFLSKPH